MPPNYEHVLIERLKNVLSNHLGQYIYNTDLEKLIGSKDLLNRVLRKNNSFSELSLNRINNTIITRLSGDNLIKAKNAIDDYKAKKGLNNEENDEIKLINSLRTAYSRKIGKLVSLSRLSQTLCSKDTLHSVLRKKISFSNFTLDKIESSLKNNLTGTNFKKAMQAIEHYRFSKNYKNVDDNCNRSELELINSLKELFSNQFKKPLSMTRLSKLIASEKLLTRNLERRGNFSRYIISKMKIAVERYLTGINLEKGLDCLMRYNLNKGYELNETALNKEEFELIKSLQISFSREFGNYVHLTTLSKFFGSDGMILRNLKKKFRFRKSTIDEMENVVKQTLTKNNLINALESIKRYRSFKRYKVVHPISQHPDPILSRNYSKKLNKYHSLCQYLKEVVNNGPPDNIFKNYNNQPRISKFRIKGLKSKEREQIVNTFMKTNLIREILYQSFYKTKMRYNVEFENILYDIMKYCQPTLYKSEELSLSNALPTHKAVTANLVKNHENCIGIEIPIWKSIGDCLFLTGHPDLLLVKEDTVLVADYKPSDLTKLGKLRRKFFHSLPQICLYGVLIKRQFNIEKLKCITFNHIKAWIYDPEVLLESLDKILLEYNSNLIMPWKRYI